MLAFLRLVRHHWRSPRWIVRLLRLRLAVAAGTLTDAPGVWSFVPDGYRKVQTQRRRIEPTVYRIHYRRAA